MVAFCFVFSHSIALPFKVCVLNNMSKSDQQVLSRGIVPYLWSLVALKITPLRVYTADKIHMLMLAIWHTLSTQSDYSMAMGAYI